MCMRLHIWMRLSEHVLMIFAVFLVRVHVRSCAAFMLAHACACACMHAFHVRTLKGNDRLVDAILVAFAYER